MKGARIFAACVGVLGLSGVTMLILKNNSPEQRTLHLYTWSDYIDRQVLAEFETKHNVRVVEETFPNNEVMISKLKAGGAGFDVIVPSDYMIGTMRQDNLLLKLPREKIPNLTHLGTRFKNVSWDEKGEYVVPYMWGTTGIAFNSTKIANPPKSWKEFFNVARAEPAAKRISLLDDPREVIGAALKANGLSFNSYQPEYLNKAKATVLTFKPLVSRFDTMSYKDLLASGDLWMAQAYSGDIVKMQNQNPELRYVIPEDGAALWVDNLAIPANAPNPELAAEFINFVMTPEVNLKIALNIHYGTTNETARQMLPASELNNTAIYPPREVESQLELFADLGNAVEAIDNAWTEIRTAEAVQPEAPSAQR